MLDCEFREGLGARLWLDVKTEAVVLLFTMDFRDYAVHAQFSVPLKPTEEFWRLCNIVPSEHRAIRRVTITR